MNMWTQEHHGGREQHSTGLCNSWRYCCLLPHRNCSCCQGEPVFIYVVCNDQLHKYAYSYYQALLRLILIILSLEAPSGTQLEVPRPEVEIGGRRKYQIHLKVCVLNHYYRKYLIWHWYYLSNFVDGDRTDWGCATGRWRKGLYCCSGEILHLGCSI